jgi:hypothetical protein
MTVDGSLQPVQQLLPHVKVVLPGLRPCLLYRCPLLEHGSPQQQAPPFIVDASTSSAWVSAQPSSTEPASWPNFGGHKRHRLLLAIMSSPLASSRLADITKSLIVLPSLSSAYRGEPSHTGAKFRLTLANPLSWLPGSTAARPVPFLCPLDCNHVDMIITREGVRGPDPPWTGAFPPVPLWTKSIKFPSKK